MSRTHCSTTAPVFLDAEASQQHAESSLPPTQLGMCYCSLVEEEECDFGRWSRCHIRQTLTTGVSGAVSSHLSVRNATGGPFLSETVFPRFSNSSYAACCIATGLPVHVCSCDAHSLQTLQSATLPPDCEKGRASMQDGGIERLRETGGRGRGHGDGAGTVTESIKDEKGLGRSLKGLIK